VTGTLLALTLSVTAPAQLPPDFFPPPEPVPFVLPPLPVPEECPCVVPPPRRFAPRVSEKPAAVRDLVILWNDVALTAIKSEKTPPPVAARNLAILHVAIYDALNAARPAHRAFYLRDRAPAGTSPEAAAAVAAHRALLTVYPRQARQLDAALDESLEKIADDRGKQEGIEFGQSIGESILAWRERDLGTRSNYAPREELGRWQPTLPGYQRPLLPGWAVVRLFTLRDVTTLRPAGPPALTGPEYAAAYLEVKSLGGVDSRLRTQEQTEIAYFWADGAGTVTPPGHWNQIAQTIAAQRGLTTPENARLFAILNVALADAAICCWDCKYHFDFWRPVTAIRAAGRLNDPELTPDPEWKPLLETPPFPSYTSGHSTFSGAAAAALAEFFGTDEVKFTTTSDVLPGVRRSFARFSDAAKEAGMSRIYGGIHWSFDNTDGLEGGKKIGQHVARNFFKPVE
jgi:hypothetical protein